MTWQSTKMIRSMDLGVVVYSHCPLFISQKTCDDLPGLSGSLKAYALDKNEDNY